MIGGIARVIILLTALTCCVSAIGKQKDVKALTGKNFDKELAKLPMVLIEFYAPWCGHCKRLAPELQEACSELKAADPPVYCAKVDCDAEKELCGSHGVQGYPTLKIFNKGKFYDDYKGGRDKEGIVKTMLKESGPVSKLLAAEDEVEDFKRGLDLSIIGYFSSEESTEFKYFKDAAGNLKDYFRFAHVIEAEDSKNENLKKAVIYRPTKLENPYEESEYQCEIKSVAGLSNCLRTNAFGLVGYMTESNEQLFQPPVFVVYSDFNPIDEESFEPRNDLLKIVSSLTEKDNKKKFSFAVAHWSSFSQKLKTQFELEPETDKRTEPIVVAYGRKELKFLLEEEYSAENLEKFVKKVLKKKQPRYIKSEPVPENNDSPVEVLVGSTFRDFINQPKDALIEFYAPWCGHCKQLEPIYNELAEVLKNEPNLLIAKIDATANDIPMHYKVNGFPTIYFKRAQRPASPKLFDGERTLEGFIEWIAEESTHELTLFDRAGDRKDEL